MRPGWSKMLMRYLVGFEGRDKSDEGGMWVKIRYGKRGILERMFR